MPTITRARCRSLATCISACLGTTLLLTACLGDVTPPCTLSGVSVQAPSTSLSVGQSTQASAFFTAQNCSPTPTVVWSSDSTAVVTVNATGLITAIRAGGPVTVRATVNTQVGSTVVTVTP